MDADYALLVRVVEAGSLSAAGRAMGLSPAMVSKRLARLEARLGVKLAHRTTRRLTLTEAGERFHADVVAILEAVRAAEERLTGGGQSPVGPLRVAAPTSFGRLHVAPHVPAFLERYPQVELRLELADTFSDLVADRIDVAIRIAPEIPPGLVATRLADSRRVLCAAPAYLQRHGAPETLKELADPRRHRLLAADGQLPWRLVRGKQALLVPGHSQVRTNSSEVVRELCVGGVGVALRSLWDVSGLLAAGSLVRVLPELEGSLDVAIYAVRPRATVEAPAVAAFVAFMADRLGAARWELG
jgi:DNA-binding transcriptional LysR family regulator